MKRQSLFSLALIFVLSFFALNHCLAQGTLTNPIFSENFGTIADGTDITTSNTAFSYVRVSTGTTANYITNQRKAVNPGSFTGSSCRLGAKSTSVTTVDMTGLTAFSSGTFIFNFKTPADLSLSGSTLFAAVGTGASFGSANAFTGNQVSAGFQVNGTNLQIRANGGWTTVQTVTTSTAYEVCVVFNNTSGSMTYGNGITLPANRAHIWVNGVKAANDYTAATADLAASAFRIYVQIAEFEIDDVAVYNTLPADDQGSEDIPNIVISGVYSGGGNNGAPFQNDYIELYNTTNFDINIGGYVLYYASAAGANTSSSYTIPAYTIGAKKFALIKAAGGTNGVAWPVTFDLECSLALATASGKLLLLSASYGGNVPLSSLASIQALANYVDYMPFGMAATPVFGTTTADLKVTSAAKRQYNDVTKEIAYTYDVGADFDIIEPIDANTPRNSSYGASTPTVATPTFTPAAGAYTTAKTITITSITADVDIYYTINGDAPTADDILYTVPVELNVAGTYTIKAIALKTDYLDSEIASATYIIKMYETGECDMFEDFEANAWKATAYAKRTVTDLAGNQWIVAGLVNTDANDRYFDTQSVRLRGNGAADTADNTNRIEMNFDRPEGFGIVSFNYASYGTHNGGVINLEYSTDQGTTWTNAGTVIAPSWATGGSVMQEASFDINIPGPARIRIIKYYASSSNSVNIDNLCITDFSGVISTPTFSILGGNYLNPFDVTIDCAMPGATIRYTTTGIDPTETSPVYSAPINISSTTTLKARAWLGTYTPSAVATAVYSFPVEVNNIAEFKAANTPTATTFRYKITGDVTFVFKNSNNYYIKDASAGLVVYDQSGIITKTYNDGDVISGGITGTYTYYNGLNEFVPVLDFAAGTPGTPVEPITVTMADLLADFYNYESQLIKLEEVTFAADTFGTVNNGNINIYQNTDQMICRNHFNTITGYVTNPDSRFDVTGFAVPYITATADDRQIAPRDLDDIYESEYTLTVLASPTVGGTITGGGNYHYNDEVTITATPNEGYKFIQWNDGNTNASRTVTITGNITYTATFQQYFTLTINILTPGFGTVNPAGVTEISAGGSQPVTFTPNTGYHVENVWVDGVSANIFGNPELNEVKTLLIENIEANHTIEVAFALNYYTLTKIEGLGGTVTMTPNPVYHGSDAIVIFEISDCHNVLDVLFNGASQGIISQHEFTNVQASLPVVELVTKAKTYTVTATPSQTENPTGYFSPAGVLEFDCGDSPTLNIVVELGYRPARLYVDGEVQPAPANLKYTFNNIRENHTIAVEFETYDPYIISFGSGANGNVVPVDNQDFGGYTAIWPGGDQLFHIIPNTGYTIDQVFVDGVSVQNAVYTGNYLFKDIMENHTIFATFKPITFTVTAHSASQGTISPAGVTTVSYGATLTFNITPNAGYEIDELKVNNENVTPALQYVLKNITENHTVFVTYKPTSYTITATAGTGGVITPSGMQEIIYGGSQLYTFTPNEGYRLVSVIIDNVPNTNALQQGLYMFMNVKENHTIKANFEKITYKITAFAGQGGTISPNGTLTVAYGNAQPFTFFASTGYKIDKLYVDGAAQPDAVAQSGTYTFSNVSENHTINVTFKALQYTITPTAGTGGTITPGTPTTVNFGATQMFYFTPKTAYFIDQVLIDGVNNLQAVANQYYTFSNITEDHSIEVIFKMKTFEITASASAGGTITPNGTTTVNYGETITFTFPANTGYHISDVLVDGVSNSSAVTAALYTFTNVTEPHTIQVIFAINTYTIKASVNNPEYGTITPAGITTVEYGNSVTYTITPYANYHIDDVLINGTSQGILTTYTFENVIENGTVEVLFGSVGVNENELSKVTVYSYQNSVCIKNESNTALLSVEITDMLGRIVYQANIVETITYIMLHQAAGIYAVRILTEDQRIICTKISVN